MPNREISDEEYNFLQQARQERDLAATVWNDPVLGKEARGLLKRKMPNLQIPDYDIRNEMDQRFAAYEQKRHEETAADQRQKEDHYWKEQRTKVQKDYGFTDDGIQDLEKFMIERNVGDYEVAATYHAAKNPKPSEPTLMRDPYWNHGKSDAWKEIAKDPEEWGRSEIMKALTNQHNKQSAF